tara:strand:+ start:364 stop:612 length:249 start_codon:yes stop_codon:yes gene_type:complete
VNIKNYSTLKSASKVAFSKDGDDVKLTEKRFNSSTGEAYSDLVKIVELDDYKQEKSRLESDKSELESLITELGKIITDIEAL